MATRRADALRGASEKRPTGRPSKWRPEFMQQARKLALLGLTDKEMADVLEVSEKTLNTWKKEVPGFLQSITQGKAVADGEVAERLYQRALGYSHPETVINCFQGVVIKTRVTRHYPPDTPAASLWLRNRQPGLWRSQPDPTDPNTEAPPPTRVVIEVKSARLRPDDADA